MNNPLGSFLDSRTDPALLAARVKTAPTRTQPASARPQEAGHEDPHRERDRNYPGE